MGADFSGRDPERYRHRFPREPRLSQIFLSYLLLMRGENPDNGEGGVMFRPENMCGAAAEVLL